MADRTSAQRADDAHAHGSSSPQEQTPIPHQDPLQTLFSPEQAHENSPLEHGTVLKLVPKLHEDLIVTFDTQASSGTREAIAGFLGKGDRTDNGGQVSFEYELAVSLRCQNLNLFLDENQPGTSTGRYLKTMIITQEVKQGRHLKHSEVFEGCPDVYSPVTTIAVSPEEEAAGIEETEIVRLPMGDRAGIEEYANADKIDLNKDGENIHLSNIDIPAREAVNYLVDRGIIPGTIRVPFGMSAACIGIMRDQFRRRIEGFDPDVINWVGQVHSSGESSLKRLIDETLEAAESQGPISGRKAFDIISSNVLDKHNGRAYRMIGERLWAYGSVIASTEQEADGLFMHSDGTAAWHSKDVPGLPKLKRSNVHIIEPGIHPGFYPRFRTDAKDRFQAVENRMEGAKEILNTIHENFPEERREKPIMVARGRWVQGEDRKGFYSLIRAMAKNPALRDNINLVIFVGNNDSNLNPLDDFKQFPSEKNGTTLIMGRIRDQFRLHPSLQDCVQFVRWTNQFDQAALMQHMGEKNIAAGKVLYLGGSFAPEEPLGFVPAENSHAGVLSLATVKTGAAAPYRDAGCIHLYNFGKPEELQHAVKNTLDGGTDLLERQIKVAEQQKWLSKAENFARHNISERRRDKSEDITPLMAKHDIFFDFLKDKVHEDLPSFTDHLHEVLKHITSLPRYRNKILTDDLVREVFPDLAKDAEIDENKKTAAMEKLLYASRISTEVPDFFAVDPTETPAQTGQ